MHDVTAQEIDPDQSKLDALHFEVQGGRLRLDRLLCGLNYGVALLR
jgi:hypothetical protein